MRSLRRSRPNSTGSPQGRRQRGDPCAPGAPRNPGAPGLRLPAPPPPPPRAAASPRLKSRRGAEADPAPSAPPRPPLPRRPAQGAAPPPAHSPMARRPLPRGPAPAAPGERAPASSSGRSSAPGAAASAASPLRAERVSGLPEPRRTRGPRPLRTCLLGLMATARPPRALASPRPPPRPLSRGRQPRADASPPNVKYTPQTHAWSPHRTPRAAPAAETSHLTCRLGKDHSRRHRSDTTILHSLRSSRKCAVFPAERHY